MWSKLIELAQEKGITLPPTAADTFQRYYEAIIHHNQHTNLTRITAPFEVMAKHFLDSLELLAWKKELTGPMLDVGSGAGFPGLPLKIACPDMTLTLLDSSRKRITFLEQTCAHLGLEQVQAVHGRAEDYGRLPVFRQQYPLVASRAVARLAILCELCLPFVREQGYFVAYKGPEGVAEVNEAENAIHKLGGQTEATWPYMLPDQLGERVLIIIRKVQPTPNLYPRKAGVPEKRPLT